MAFNSFIFFIFLGLVIPVFYAFSKKSSKNLFLVFASYVFYGYWDWRFCSLLAFSTIVDFFLGKLMHSAINDKKRRIIFIISLFSDLGILGFFKYFNFFIDSFQSLSAQFGVNIDFLHTCIIIPIGISFYTFKNISYTIEVYQKKIPAANNLVDYALFVSFFPVMVAGPIERASNLLPQLSKKLIPSSSQIKEGIALIAMGLFRKVMIGDTAGRYVDHIFGDLETYKSIEVISGLVLFSVQIYADFSGYSHIARGTAKLFGVEIMRNFEQPYFSRNIAEFWKRWHISLSSWFMNYLFLPIAYSISRKLTKLRYFSIKADYLVYSLAVMATFLLCGLWHGAAWTFVIWGGMHGVYLVLYKLFSKKSNIPFKKIQFPNIKTIFNILTTNILVLFTWLFFRCTSWHSIRLFFSKIIYWEDSEYALWFIKTTATFVILVFITDLIEYTTGRHDFILSIKSKPFRYGLLTGLFMLTLLFMFQSKISPFLYLKF